MRFLVRHGRAGLRAGLLALWWLMAAPAGAHAADSWPGVIQQACLTLAAARPVTSPGPQLDLELYLLAAGWERLGGRAEAFRLRRYLFTFYPDSPLCSLLPPQESGPTTGVYEPNPAFSRLVKSVWGHAVEGPAEPPGPEVRNFAEILPAYLRSETGGSLRPLLDVLRNDPEAPYAGWIAYQAAWAERTLTGSDAALRRLWLEHRDHPLGREALAAAGEPYFPPRRLAVLSGLLPGLGEGRLEPGVRESGSTLYAEVLYAGATAGFLLAAQQQNRVENLAGALIFANLLFLNHQNSAERTYALAWRRNAAEHRRFVQERLEQEVAGSGRFEAREPAPPSPPGGHWVVGLDYPALGAADGFRGRGLVHDAELVNASWRIEYQHRIWPVALGKTWQGEVVFCPRGRWWAGRAFAEPPSTTDLAMQEWALAMEVGWLTRWDLGGPWLEVRLSGGPAIRDRRLDWGGRAYTDSGLAWSGAAVLALGGPGGFFWSLGIYGDDSFQPGSLAVDGSMLSIPSRSVLVGGSLGLSF